MSVLQAIRNVCCQTGLNGYLPIFFLFGELSDSNYKNEQTKRDKLALGANAILVIVFVYFNGS